MTDNPPFRHSPRRGAVMMEYVIVVTVMAVAMLFAATWLTGWNGESEQPGGAVFRYGGQTFQKQSGVGPELKGMYQRVQAGIALPCP